MSHRTNKLSLSSKKRILEASLATVTMVILGFISTVLTAEYIALHGFNSSLMSAEFIGISYSSLLFFVAYFDFNQKSWAFAVSVLLAGLSISNTLSGLGEGLAINIGIKDSILLIVSLLAIITSLIAYSKLRTLAIDVRA